MSYQRCPVCDGIGWTGVGFPTGETCSVCLGQKIIDTQTGMPPYKITTSSGTTIEIPRPEKKRRRK